MKIASRILSLVILVVTTTFYMGCKKDDNEKKSTEETQLDKLKGTWALLSASDDGGNGNRTTDFPGLVLTVAGNYVAGGTYNYSFTGTRPDPSPWPANGTWKFGTDPLTQLDRDPGTGDEISMNYSVTNTDLIISFNIPDGSEGWPGGRIGSVRGDWTFTFQKQ